MHVENQFLEIVILLLLIAALVGTITRRLRLPYTLGLVIMGLVLGLFNQPGSVILPEVIVQLVMNAIANATPALILGILVTPLVFEAAFHLRWDDLSSDLWLILALAIPGVILTTLFVGGLVAAGTHLPIGIALVFGALMAATDPVSVVALFRSMGVPNRLQVILEGESLFNDGTAIVAFTLVLGLVQASLPAGGIASISLQVLFEFIGVVGGGLLIGAFEGWLVAQMISRIDEPLIETTLTAVLAYGAYLTAERFQVSGVLAVVAAGLVCGNVGPRGMSPSTRIAVANFWETIAFLANSFVFLLIGIETNLADLVIRWQAVFIAILAVLTARAAVVYGLSWIGKNVSMRWNHVLFWGGLRGAISLTLAISLPQQLGPELGLPLKSMTFGVVLFTILVQGFSMRPLVQRLELVQRSPLEDEFERRHGRAVAARASLTYLNKLHASGALSDHTWYNLSPLLESHSEALAGGVKEVMLANPALEAQELSFARRAALRAQRSALRDLLIDGIISDEIYSELKGELDLSMTENSEKLPGIPQTDPANPAAIRRLMVAVIQMQDIENATNELNKAGLAVTRLSSSGGFLGRRNVTLLIGIPEGLESIALQALAKSCHRRVEYVATQLEGAPFPLPLTTPVIVGGATIFTFNVDRYEEII